ncbi:CHAT domain-containing protein [Nocardiopsis baichengensis]|uniref:CHAT domain-containing protein n=1 Tax=Nocardiopsis baichengensis TaxID=280240 RepID=UPI0003471958|nr:CHAT domain-containing protein [Nocardiopsis baichengensis]
MQSPRPRRPFDTTDDPATLVARDPESARAWAEGALASGPDPRVRAHALCTLGICLHEEGDPAAAHRLLGRAAAVASSAGLDGAAARARQARLAIRALHGGPGLSGPALGRRTDAATALLRCGVAEAQRGRFPRALAALDAALERVGPHAPARLLPALLANRGLALVYADRTAEAADDLAQALALADERRLDYLRAAVLQNLGCLAVRHGETAEAMRLFDEAAARSTRSRRIALRIDGADALLAAGLPDQARIRLESFGGPAAAGPLLGEAAARLVDAKHRLARGDRGAAIAQVRRVRARFAPDSLWAALAASVEWSARCLSAPEQATGVRRRTAARCAVYSPTGAAGAVRPSRDQAAAAALLDSGRHAAALRRLAGVERPGHAEAAGHARPRERGIAAEGARRALAEGRGEDLLAWLEYGRSGRGAAVCRDGSWAELLERLRDAYRRADDGEEAAFTEIGHWSARLAAAQWHRCRTAPPPGGGVLEGLRDRLGDRVLVSYAVLGGECVAVAVAEDRVAVHRLGPVGRIEAESAKFAFDLRLAALRGEGGGHGAAVSAALLDRMLLGPASGLLGDRPVVVCPAPVTQELPWGRLPSLRGREVCVAPSARAWLDADAVRAAGTAGTAAGAGPAVVACGPRVPGASAEAARVRDVLSGAGYRTRLLSGAEATVPELRRRLPEAPVAHLIGHGGMAPEAPMLAALLFADGPLFAYDAEMLSAVPPTVVLSACWLGVSTPAPSGAPLGMGSALLSRGARTVVASAVPVRDLEIAGPMTAFHSAVASGTDPARAVADHLAEHGFLCMGAG